MPQVHLRLAYFIFGGQAKRAVEFSLLRKSYSLRSLATASARSNNSFAAMRGHLVWRAHISNGSPVARIRSWRRAKYRSWSKAAITPKARSEERRVGKECRWRGGKGRCEVRGGS